ncbi:MAG TPA: phytanoyl-CoA dioxygenase family protein [Alphaproteobacteria bacterium]|nr:phytanoyl-CoA dioxygenase family protein [Alphaproteobacteria bacterium]
MNREPMHPISEADIESYERDGAVCLRGMFDADWVKRMHDATMAYREAGAGRLRVVQKGAEKGQFYSNVFMCGGDPDFLAFRDTSPAAKIAASLMRVDRVRFWYDQLFVKDPGTTAVTQWHHDLPFWPFQGEHLISIWVAFTPVTKASSGVEYIAGSHRWGKFYRPVTPDEDPAFANPDLEPCPNFSERADDPDLRFLSWDLEPGDCLCHHPLTVHGAGGNKSADQLRIGLSVRFLGDDVQWDPRPYTVKLPKEPDVAKGAYPADDALFPVIWERGHEAA